MGLFDDDTDEEENYGDIPDAGWGDLTAPTITSNTNKLKAPREMSYLHDHKAVEESIIRMIGSHTLPHGLIFAGMKGIGKATFAHRLAKYLVSLPVQDHDPNQNALFGDDLPAAQAAPPPNLDTVLDDKNVRLYLAGAHPDCLTIEPAFDSTGTTKKSSVDVDEVRKITPFLRKTSSNGGWRIVIVDDADTMNRNAQNAILKILEEPPAKTLIILIAHRAGNLIPTIRSRTRTITFQPLNNDTIKTLLQNAEIPPPADQLETLASIAGGSIGKALEMHEEEGMETLTTILDILAPMPQWNWDKIHKTADNFTRKGAEKSWLQFQSILTDIFKTLCQCKAKETPLPPYLAKSEPLQKLMQTQSLPQILAINDALESHFNRGNFANLDKKSILLQAMALIAA